MLSGCPLPSPAGTPFQEVSAQSEICSGVHGVLVVCYCARALVVFACPPLPLCFCARFGRFPHRTLVGPYQEECACECFLLESVALLVEGWGGGASRSSRLSSCFSLVFRGLSGLAHSLSRPPVLWACSRSPRPFFLGCGGAAVGIPHRPHSARSCELVLHAVEAAGGTPWGQPASCLSEGGLWTGAHSPPRILWGRKSPKPATVRNTTFFVNLYHKEHIFRS